MVPPAAKKEAGKLNAEDSRTKSRRKSEIYGMLVSRIAKTSFPERRRFPEKEKITPADIWTIRGDAAFAQGFGSIGRSPSIHKNYGTPLSALGWNAIFGERPWRQVASIRNCVGQFWYRTAVFASSHDNTEI